MNGAPVEAIGFAAGALGALAAAPQIFKIARTGDAKDISLNAYLIMLAAAGLWIIYGALRGLAPIVLWNSVWLATSVLVIVMKLRSRS